MSTFKLNTSVIYLDSMKKIVITFLAILLANTIYSQTKIDLNKALWQKAQSCYSNFEDLNKEEKKNLDIIDDTKNGYLEICGIYPTCGCYCSTIVSAYKDTNNNYTFIQTNEETCNWVKSVSSNKEIASILPENFGFNSFSSAQIIPFLKNPAFYLNFIIPRKGTDTKVTPELIPFGLNIKQKSAWVYSYSQNKAEPKSISDIKKIVTSIENNETITYLISEAIDSISPKDLKVIKTSIANKAFSSTKELSAIFTELKNIYNTYLTIQHSYIILGWNKEKGSFFIKEKGDKPKTITFKNFLLHANYWEPIC